MSTKYLILLVELVAFPVAFYPMQLVAVDPLLLKGGVKQLTSRNHGNCESTDTSSPNSWGHQMLDQTDLVAFERLNPPVPWTGAEVEQLFRLRVTLGLPWEEVAAKMGRTESGVRSKFKYVQFWQAVNNPSVPGVREQIPDSVLNEQARRLAARPRDLVGLVCGDPPKGFSALDKRMAGHRENV